MHNEDIPFFRLAMNCSEQWAREFRSRPLEAERQAEFEQAAGDSLSMQRTIEEGDEIDFEAYLARYYTQYDKLGNG